MEVMFMQSSDATKYIRMLKITSPTVINYCENWNCQYNFFVGIKRGNKPWHAALNRIFMLHDLVKNEYQGWLIYIDADAFIVDKSFNVREYLAGYPDSVMIAAPSGLQPQQWWDINNGVFALNLGSEHGKQIVESWYNRILLVDDNSLLKEENWGDAVDDQHQLHIVLRESPELEPLVVHDRTNLNGNARFIQQIMRVDADFEARIKKISQIISHRNNTSEDVEIERNELYTQYINALYRVLFEREADSGGFASSLTLLKTGQRSIEQQLRACVASDEFKRNIARLIADK